MAERLRALDIPAEAKEDLAPLLDRPPVLSSHATRMGDGRRIPIAFARVRDQQGLSRAGVEVRLLDKEDGRVLDLSRTDPDGLVVLRFPAPAHGDPVRRGWLEVTGTAAGQDVVFEEERRAAIVDLVLPELPPLPTQPDPRGGEPVRVPLAGDDVIPRLPSIFDPQVCDALNVVLPTRPHPILGLVPGVDPADFRSKTTPIIRRLSERRVGFVGPGVSSHGNARGTVRRYVVRLRQEWRLLGYTLGELAEVQALDPGAIVEEVTRTADATTSQVLDETQRLVATATAWLRRTLDDVRSIDNVVKQTTDYTTKVISSGVPSTPATTATVSTGGGFDWGGAAVGAVAGFLLGGPVGAVAGGAAGGVIGGAGKTTSVTLPGLPGVPSTSQVLPTLVETVETVDAVDTTLHVTDRLKTVQDQVNEATRQVYGVLQTVERMVGRTVEQVSPLLQRVTNLLRWRVYENYLVCTHVEDVLEVKYLQLPGCGGAEDVFSDEDVVEYRPFFEPWLLDPSLRPYYDELARAVRARDALLASVYLEVTYRSPTVVTSTFPFGLQTTQPLPPAQLHVSLGATSFSVPIPGGQGTTGGVFPIVPLRLDRPVELRLTLDATAAAAAVAGTPFENAAAALEIAVDRVRLWFEKSPGLPADHDDALGGGLVVTIGQPQATLTRTFNTPATEGEPINSPLTRHVNRNCRYYLGLLLQAAIAIPSLRDDAPELGGNPLFNSDSPIWHMPIVGVEGDKLVFLAEADPADPNVVQWLADPGTATLFQLQAPGAYAEALQGLLELADVLKYLHPALKQDPPPVVAALPVTTLTSPPAVPNPPTP